MTQDLTNYRNEIDAIDQQLITALAKRMEIVLKVGAYKKQHKLKPLDATRWQEVIESRKSIAQSLNLSPELIEVLWNSIHQEALTLQK